MAGAYCRYCDTRCFVLRTLPTTGQSLHLATCKRGMEHDRETCGFDHTTAANPCLTDHPEIPPANGASCIDCGVIYEADGNGVLDECPEEPVEHVVAPVYITSTPLGRGDDLDSWHHGRRRYEYEAA